MPSQTFILLAAIATLLTATFADAATENEAVNAMTAKLRDGEHAHYRNIFDRFLTQHRELIQDVMPDGTHLGAKGHQTWADAIEPTIKELLGK
jgi:lysophospholipase L1-like esterase